MKSRIRNMTRCGFAAAVLAALTACGGGDSGPAPPPAPAMYTVGGTVTGLTGSGLLLASGFGNLPVSAAGTFTFGTRVVSGTPYSVSVEAQPSSPTQYCSVANGSGIVAAANVTNVSVTCEPPPLMISRNPSPPTATVGVVYPPFGFASSGGLAPLVWTPPTVPMGGLAVSLDGILSGTPSTAGIFPITLTVKDALSRSSPATPFTVRVAMARPDSAFMPTGSMTVARDGHTATLLLDGRVLIVGGGSASAELYDTTSQTFTATGSMTVARIAHSATLLANSKLPNYGKVLVVGYGDSIAELYDPTAGTFTATGSMVALRLGQTATLLQNGQVLIAGGETATAELFNPSTGAFTATGSMTVSRSRHSATLLPDGRVLIAGGVLVAGACCIGPIPFGPGVASTELYDPVSGTFTSTGSMSEGRFGHTATLLVDGTVLVTGTDKTAELFSPSTGTFSVVGELSTGFGATLTLGATATLRNDGTVLVAGGLNRVSRGTAQLFAPESGGFVATGSLITARDGHTATLLVDGTVLITGGTSHMRTCHPGGPCSGSNAVLSSAELFK